jgi:hypothetical protein
MANAAKDRVENLIGRFVCITIGWTDNGVYHTGKITGKFTGGFLFGREGFFEVDGGVCVVAASRVIVIKEVEYVEGEAG